MYQQQQQMHGGGGRPSRVVELMDSLKNEVETLNHEISMYKQYKDEYDRKLQAQMQEITLIQQTLQELERGHARNKQQYEEEIIRLKKQLELTNGGGARDLNSPAFRSNSPAAVGHPSSRNTPTPTIPDKNQRRQRPTSPEFYPQQQQQQHQQQQLQQQQQQGGPLGGMPFPPLEQRQQQQQQQQQLQQQQQHKIEKREHHDDHPSNGNNNMSRWTRDLKARVLYRYLRHQQAQSNNIINNNINITAIQTNPHHITNQSNQLINHIHNIYIYIILYPQQWRLTNRSSCTP
ncbi:hypothetical protein SAMD00019534_046570, partial [Acytostelium subglobosum LB1]|uniref:hypothetical protein n=1 Tax=Acytostelium subglobosum LB1 TaxID=1410327 RepID=UPI000644E48D